MTNSTLGHVFVVDDNTDIRFYLTDLLQKMGYSVEGFDGAQAFMSLSMDIFPAVLVLDVRMPGISGIELQSQLQSQGRHTPIVFISGESQSEEIIQAMKGRPIEFLLKPFRIQHLIDAIDKGLLLDVDNRRQFIRHNEVRRRWSTLSARECDVFVFMLQGHTNKGIASHLEMLPDTAKKHRANILEKMQVHSLAELLELCKDVDLTPLRA
jgi:FixJ family two-component response regulator